MNIANNKQSGFSAVLSIIAIVLVVGVVGFIGLRLYSQPSKQTSSTIPSTSNNQSNPISNGPTNIATVTTQGTYLDIKEEGVKIQLDNSIKDATYTIKTDTDGSQFAYISTTSLTTASQGNCSPANGGFASVTKASGTPQQVFGPAVPPVDNTQTFKFGTDTYVFIGRPNGSCTQDPTAIGLYRLQQATFFNDFKTLQPDQ